MYKLLLVTDKPDIQKLYNTYPDWEAQGFEKPTVMPSADSGIYQLTNKHFDVVSWLLPIKEGKQMSAYIVKKPEIMGIETVRDSKMLHRELGYARRELVSRDAQRQVAEPDDLTRVMWSRFFCDLLRGESYTANQIDEKLYTLGITGADPARPVSMASFRLPQGDFFLSEVWQYGRDRLENALRNIFENTGSRELVCVLLMINPHHMRLMMIPFVDMSKEDVYASMVAHLERCQTSLEQYFELTMNIRRMNAYDSLYELASENLQRTAH
ncbi:MAG: hypothetical protein IJ242_05595 [Clostridia bacterium]|nr:hypothetical protein [Clostridia bacterium]